MAAPLLSNAPLPQISSSVIRPENAGFIHCELSPAGTTSIWFKNTMFGVFSDSGCTEAVKL